MTVIDGPQTIQVLLNDGSRWITSNHSGTIATDTELGTFELNEKKPIIMVINDMKIALTGATNNIYIYQVSDLIDFSNYARRTRYDHKIRMSVIVRSTTRVDAIARQLEAQRIIETFSTSISTLTLPTGYTNCFNQLWILNKQDKSNTIKNFHMWVFDVELISIGVVLAT